MVCRAHLLLLAFAAARALSGDGRFNKAYCLEGAAWGDAAFWQRLANSSTYRVAQLSTSNTSGTFFLSVTPLGSFALSPVVANVSIDLGCQPRSLPHYGAIAYGTYGGGGAPVWAPGPIGDASKAPRCWWVRCSQGEARADHCGSEGEAPCARLGASFLRYAAPSGPPLVDEACYPIALDSQVDPLHRVDFEVRFVDGLWPPPAAGLRVRG